MSRCSFLTCQGERRPPNFFLRGGGLILHDPRIGPCERVLYGGCVRLRPYLDDSKADGVVVPR